MQNAKNRPTIHKSNQRPEIDKKPPNSQELTQNPYINPKAKNQLKRQKSFKKPKIAHIPKIEPKARNQPEIDPIAKN